MLQVVKIFVMLIIAAPHNSTAKNQEDIFLSKGEQYEIPAQGIKSFSIGNKEVLKARYRDKNHHLLIKGRGIGFSDLIVWTHSGKKTYRVYIHSKRKQLTEMELYSVLKDTGLNIKMRSDWLEIKGNITNLKDYQIIKNTLSNEKLKIISEIKLEKKFKNELIASVYDELYTLGVESVTCKVVYLDINCSVVDKHKMAELKSLSKKYQISFSNSDLLKENKTYHIELKIFSLTTIDGNHSQSGISKIEGSLAQAFNENRVFLNTDNFLLKDFNIKSELIANPSFYAVVGEKFNFSIGQEIPIQQTTQTSAQTDWKFSGIKASGKIENRKDVSFLNIKSQITAPTKEGNIQGPSNQTSFIIKQGEYTKLFKVNLKNIISDSTSIPILNKIPILKSLFSHDSNISSSKYIYFFIKVEELQNE